MKIFKTFFKRIHIFAKVAQSEPSVGKFTRNAENPKESFQNPTFPWRYPHTAYIHSCTMYRWFSLFYLSKVFPFIAFSPKRSRVCLSSVLVRVFRFTLLRWRLFVHGGAFAWCNSVWFDTFVAVMKLCENAVLSSTF